MFEQLQKALEHTAMNNALLRLVNALHRIAPNHDAEIGEDDAAFEQKHPRGDKGRFSTIRKLKAVAHDIFHSTLSEAKRSQKEESRWRVDVHDVNDYKGTKNYVSADGSTIAINNGDIISVCKKLPHEDGAIRGKELMSIAVSLGGNKLDSFDGNYRFYRACGFEPVSWTPFSEEYAPEGWVKGRDNPEDVIFFAWTGNKRKMEEDEARVDMENFKKSHAAHTGDTGYDEAKKERDDFLDHK